uniref:efflux transporter outer membrane subunit n=1 Tax=Massilia sp. TaxID=1882437 RepID=UPI0028A91300
LTLFAGAVLTLAGCAHVPVDQSTARAPDFAQAQHADTIVLARDAWPVETWWRDYRDNQLDALMDQALAASPSLAAAQARFAVAQAVVKSEQATGGAQVGVGAGLNRQRYSANGLFPEPIGGSFYTDSTLQVRASYDVDWWGKHRAQVAAAVGEANANAAEAAQARQALTALVAQSYFRLQLLWARDDNMAALAKVQRALLADRNARLAHGLATVDAQRGVELELGRTLEQSELLRTQAAREREILRALVAAGTDDLASLERQLPPMTPATLPRTLGIELLARRPDLQAARWRVEAALGRVRASEAAFYPDLNLAGSFGLNAISLGKLLRGASRTMLGGVTLELPLFDSGRLEAGLGVARAERDALLAEYNDAVLAAVRDVAAEGATLQGIGNEIGAHAMAEQAAARLASSAETRLKRGLAERSSLLQAQLETLRQRDGALQLQDARLQTEVALVRALGGGYRAQPIATAAVSASASASTQQH